MNLALSETPKTDFLMLRPISYIKCSTDELLYILYLIDLIG